MASWADGSGVCQQLCTTEFYLSSLVLPQETLLDSFHPKAERRLGMSVLYHNHDWNQEIS